MGAQQSPLSNLKKKHNVIEFYNKNSKMLSKSPPSAVNQEENDDLAFEKRAMHLMCTRLMETFRLDAAESLLSFLDALDLEQQIQ